MIMQELVLIRGLPGSGKSTMASKEHPEHGHIEADDYFYREGQYKFDPAKLQVAHAECQARVRRALGCGSSVVVSNTFTQLWEMEPYRQMARELGVPLTVRVATGNYQNIHGVPDAVIERMRQRWES